MTTIDNIMALADNYATLTADTSAITKSREALRTALTEALAAQPVREPLAWWITGKKTDEKFVTTRPDDWSNKNWNKHQLYAAPQPVRDPLAPEHIERIYQRYGGCMINCTRAIERAHGIGGDK